MISALGALESAMGESGASSVDGSETAEEAMTDDQLEARVDTLQSELDELTRDSGNSGSESENAGEAGVGAEEEGAVLPGGGPADGKPLGPGVAGTEAGEARAVFAPGAGRK